MGRFRPLIDDDAAVICHAPQNLSSFDVADRATFQRRFAERTGSLLEGADWTDFFVIGGMALSCLVADEHTFKRFYAETDVDIYFVGVEGTVFKEKIVKLLTHLATNAPLMSVVRTSQAITVLPGADRNGNVLPNIQIILAPYHSVAHL